jgi:hypothetical protein
MKTQALAAPTPDPSMGRVLSGEAASTSRVKREAHHMRRLSLAAALPLLVACDSAFEKAFDLAINREANVVVLLRTPTQLGPTTAAFSSTNEAMKVLGERSRVCLSLRGDVPHQDAKVMDRIFSEAMGDAKVKVELTLANGARVKLRQPLQAWSLLGTIVKHNELAACASTPCKAELPVGAQVSEVELSADLPLTIQGVYWSSETDPTKPPLDKQQASSASPPKTSSACSE